MTPEDRDAIRARLAAATRGPWRWDGLRVPTLEGRAGDPEAYEYDTEVLSAEHYGECGCRSACKLELLVGPADADLIAHAPTDLAALLDALDEALDTVEDLVIQHCYAESDGSYDTSALSTNRDAFDLLVRAGRAKYVGKQVGRRAFIRLTEATP